MKMKKFLSSTIWRKLISISIVLFFIILILFEKQNSYKFINQANEQIIECKKEIESLSTQLTVVNSHRRKLDEALLKQQTEMNKAVHDLRTKLDETQEQKQQLQTKYDSCLNSKNENEKTNDLNKISIDNANDEKLKNENEQLKNQIMALTNELEKFKKEMVSMKHSRNEIQPEKNDTVQDPLHPPEEHKGYADGDSIHFHRKIPNSIDLEFKRNDDLPKLPQILSGSELMKKLEDKNKNGKKNDDGKQKIIDYQQNQKPNVKEEDYKEME